MADPTSHYLIIDARIYNDIADELVRGAGAALEKAEASWDRVSVPGVLEIPAALSMAIAAMDEGGPKYDGFVLLGCVVRGETSHYDLVANETARAIMVLAIDECLALGNGILTVENVEQAWARAKIDQKNKGGEAAKAALAMARVRTELGL